MRWRKERGHSDARKEGGGWGREDDKEVDREMKTETERERERE